jgi:hypothetical protein
VELSGSASRRAFDVFLEFEAKNATGGTWSGRGSFTLKGAQLVGQIQGKSGDEIAALLKKI